MRSASQLIAVICALGACNTAPTQRQICLNEIQRFEQFLPSPSREARVLPRLQRLAESPEIFLSHREAAWILVAQLNLGYRLRHGDGPVESQALLEDMGLMRAGSGNTPISLSQLRLLMNRAALPETELLLPAPCPLPAWLCTP